MRRTRRRLVAAVLLVVAVALVGIALRNGPTVTTEGLDVEVSDPGGGTIRLDAALTRPAHLDDPVPAVVLAHGFGGSRHSLRAAAEDLAARGYVVLTYSARGFGGSDGVVGLNDPQREVADVTVLLDLLAERADVAHDGDGDPRVAIAGGSYGGALALLAAADDPRIDAVVAAATWHDLAASLAPNAAGSGAGVVKSQWLSVLFASGSGNFGVVPAGQGPADPCGRLDPMLCALYEDTIVGGRLDATGALAERGLSGQAARITAPTLLIQGIDDTLFGLAESVATAREIADGGTVALRWIAGGHGQAADLADGPTAALLRDWLARWLPLDRGTSGDVGEVVPFAWRDTVAGADVEEAALPSDLASAPVRFGLAPGALLPADSPAPTDQTSAEIVAPAGGLPAALSTLPGLGTLDGLLPPLDIPGQHAAFTTAPLERDLRLLGAPTLDLAVTGDVADRPLFVKLFDVTPGGNATLIGGSINPLRLEQPGSVSVQLDHVAHRLVAGNRLRLVVATTDQGFAVDGPAGVITLALSGTSLTAPTSATPVASTLPDSVRVLLPVGVLILSALVGLALVRRVETRRAAPVSSADPPPPVRIRGLTKRYPDGTLAVDGLDVTVQRGQVVGLLGPNGAGKTTTLRMLLGLIHPDEGQVELLGHAVTPGTGVLHRVGVLVEGPGFAPYLSGRQNLESYWCAGGRPLAQANMDRALGVAALGADIDRPVRTYSHGMRQRLAIAQALLGDPELLVLDEPTDGLDPEQIRGMRQLLARLGRDGVTILVSSHLLAEVEQMCTHVVVMRQGRLVTAGPIEALKRMAGRRLLLDADDIDRAESVLAASGVAVTSIASQTSLEEVFLDLTTGPEGTADGGGRAG